MKRFKALSIAMAIMFTIGFSACGEDETMQELIDETELNQPLGNDEGDDNKPGGE